MTAETREGSRRGARKARKPVRKMASARSALASMRVSRWFREERMEKGGEARRVQCAEGRA
jgi:hypothetical protein